MTRLFYLNTIWIIVLALIFVTPCHGQIRSSQPRGEHQYALEVYNLLNKYVSYEKQNLNKFERRLRNRSNRLIVQYYNDLIEGKLIQPTAGDSLWIYYAASRAKHLNWKTFATFYLKNTYLPRLIVHDLIPILSANEAVCFPLLHSYFQIYTDNLAQTSFPNLTYQEYLIRLGLDNTGDTRNCKDDPRVIFLTQLMQFSREGYIENVDNYLDLVKQQNKAELREEEERLGYHFYEALIEETMATLKSSNISLGEAITRAKDSRLPFMESIIEQNERFRSQMIVALDSMNRLKDSCNFGKLQIRGGYAYVSFSITGGCPGHLNQPTIVTSKNYPAGGLIYDDLQITLNDYYSIIRNIYDQSGLTQPFQLYITGISDLYRVDRENPKKFHWDDLETIESSRWGWTPTITTDVTILPKLGSDHIVADYNFAIDQYRHPRIPYTLKENIELYEPDYGIIRSILLKPFTDKHFTDRQDSFIPEKIHYAVYNFSSNDRDAIIGCYNYGMRLIDQTQGGLDISIEEFENSEPRSNEWDAFRNQVSQYCRGINIVFKIPGFSLNAVEEELE
ncbi:MAG TPA: hypothetical protein DCE41_28495 [Cytophagales bacterium]|nr:hypothetical protein [Cytophagales bacterium]HAP58849.1 hypothetical protein [Cytophagales bacterium]